MIYIINQMIEPLNNFFEKIQNKKKIIEIKIGEKINSECFNYNINEKIVKSIFKKFQKNNVKYFNNKVYYYNNLQLIVYPNGSKKCYRDNFDMEKIDFSTSMDIRVIAKDREKIDELLFPCQKNYDLNFTRELISISIKNNLKINIYSKQNEDNTNNYEFSIQYLYNPKKGDDIKREIEDLVNICNEIENVLKIEKN